MPEFVYVMKPVYSPTRCALCGTTDVPMIDTCVQADVIGRIYLCCKPDPTSTNNGCAEQIAMVLGWASPDEHGALVEDLAGAHAENERLCEELQEIDQPLVVYEDDLRALIAEAMGQKKKKPE